MSAQPPIKSSLRDIAIVARHELDEAMRSRRVLILLLLFVGGAVAGTLVFVDVLESLEASLASVLAVAEPGKPGAVTTELMRSPEFMHMLSRLLHDERLARELASLPPLALFYGWVSVNFLPPLIMLGSAECISGELASGSARFSLLRTDRLSFSLGKLLGQTMLTLLGIAIGACGVWLTGWSQLGSFAPGPTALWLAILSLRIGVYAFPHVALAVGLSHLTRSVPVSRALGLLGLAVFGVLFGLGNYNGWIRAHAGSLADTVLQLLPRTHMLALWQPALIERLPALCMLLALGIAYFAAGYSYRARRDL